MRTATPTEQDPGMDQFSRWTYNVAGAEEVWKGNRKRNARFRCRHWIFSTYNYGVASCVHCRGALRQPITTAEVQPEWGCDFWNSCQHPDRCIQRSLPVWSSEDLIARSAWWDGEGTDTSRSISRIVRQLTLQPRWYRPRVFTELNGTSFVMLQQPGTRNTECYICVVD